jgi:hypothetical protein
MKIFTTVIFVFTLCINAFGGGKFQFLSPLPGSKYHNTDRNIIIREGSLLNAASLHKQGLFELKGSLSGNHSFGIVLCRDQKTVLLNPEKPFAAGETVTVTIHDGLERENGEVIEGLSFTFQTDRQLSETEKAEVADAQQRVYDLEFGTAEAKGADLKDFDGKGLPPFYITTNTNPAPGQIFFHNYNTLGIATGHHSIITNDGDSVFSRGGNTRGMDFKINLNGYMTLFNKVGNKWEMYDSSYNLVKIYKVQNGLLTDLHDIQLLPDGHCFVQAYDTRLLDMSLYDSTWSTHATVTGLAIQELDQDFNLVFEWRSWDRIDFSEAIHETLSSGYIDYVHGNSIEVAEDGNIIISCRHLDQVNKINVNTGEFMWRLGGVKNEFTFVDDPEPFTYQHDCRLLPNGNITLFDNGNWHTSPCSYAREYKLDLVNKTATLVWFYKHPKVGGADVTGWALGSVQRLDNGNTFIDWGFIYAGTNFPNVTEVTPTGEIVWEMRMYNATDEVIYRAHKYNWTPCARPSGFKMKATDITAYSAKLKWSQATGAQTYNIQYRPIGSINWITIHASGLLTVKQLNQLHPDTTYEWRMQSVCANNDSSAFSIIKEFTTLPPKLSLNETVQGLQLYPNPSAGALNIQLPKEYVGNVNVTIFNLQGQRLYEKTFSDVIADDILQLSLEGFLPRIYSVVITDGERRWVEKLVVE